MQLLEKKTKCPLCGAKNKLDANRCGICTRPLKNDALPSQAVYEEALWSSRIASKSSNRTKINPYAVLALLVVGGVILNYFVIGYGPSWAHEAPTLGKGFEWKVYRGQPEYEVDLPGAPMVGSAAAQGSTLTTAAVWVDGHWDLVRDDNTQSKGKLDQARIEAYAALVTATGNAPADPATALTGIVQAMLPNTQLEPGGIETVQDPPPGQQRLTLATNYTGFPEDADNGVVRATAIVADGRIWVAASYVRGGDDPALHQRLVRNLKPKIG